MLPATPRLTVPLEVYYFDTDAGGVVHNIAYLRMVEIARSQLAASLGWTLEEMNRTGLVGRRRGARRSITSSPRASATSCSSPRNSRRLEKVRMFMSFTIALAAQPEVTFIRCVQDNGHGAVARRPSAARSAGMARGVSATASVAQR